jgi:hypothetical protein
LIQEPLSPAGLQQEAASPLFPLLSVLYYIEFQDSEKHKQKMEMEAV